MSFAGLPFGTLLGVGGAVAAAVALLYVLKLRRRAVAVVFSHIWQRVLRDQESSELFSQLKRWLSLLLQLALVALIVLAVGDPRLSESFAKGRNVVLLLDASASMQAVDVAPSRIEVAKAEARRIVRGLGSSDRALVVSLGATVTPLSTLTDDVGDLERAIDAVAATDTRADLAAGVAFSMDALAGVAKPEIVIVSDGALAAVDRDLGEVTLSFVPVGAHGGNVAITGFSARRYPLDKSRYEAMIELFNTNDVAVEVELSLSGDGEVVDVTRLALQPKETLRRFYRDLGGASRILEASIRPTAGPPDELPADDRAYALMPERRRARVLTVTRGNTYLEAALLLDEYLEVATVTPEAYPPSGAFDVTIFDGVAPRIAREAGSLLYLNPPAEGAPVKLGRAISDFGFDEWDRKSALLRWIALENVQAAEGHSLVPEKGDRVTGASDQGPVLVEGRREGRRFVALGFNPRRSDMVLRVAWPLFLLNTIHSFVEESSGYISSFRTGDLWRIPVGADVDVALLRLPGGGERRIAAKQGFAVHLGDRAGIYGVSAGEGGDRVVTAFAANLADADESRIEPRRELSVGPRVASAPLPAQAGVRREIWLYLLLAAVALSAVEWVTYHRRVTV